ncbi:hypothetical protein VTN02DRAFT_6242 [Thermoascus thermophilus]
MASSTSTSLFPGVAVVTGAAGTGIGSATAHAFARAGCTRLALTDINGALLAETASRITSLYPRTAVLALAGDVSSETFVEAFFDAVVERFGRVDYAVNCAGVLGRAVPSGEMEVGEFDRVNGVNYRGAWLCGRREVRVMMGQDPLEGDDGDDGDGDGGRRKIPRERGSIVHIASQLGIVGRPEAPAYSASKAAVIALTRADAIDYSKHNIRVNCICPGVIETPMTMSDPETREALEPAVKIAPMGRMGTPEEVAECALFLASRRASFVQGHALVVDGGYIRIKAVQPSASTAVVLSTQRPHRARQQGHAGNKALTTKSLTLHDPRVTLQIHGRLSHPEWWKQGGRMQGNPPDQHLKQQKAARHDTECAPDGTTDHGYSAGGRLKFSKVKPKESTIVDRPEDNMNPRLHLVVEPVSSTFSTMAVFNMTDDRMRRSGEPAHATLTRKLHRKVTYGSGFQDDVVNPFLHTLCFGLILEGADVLSPDLLVLEHTQDREAMLYGLCSLCSRGNSHCMPADRQAAFRDWPAAIHYEASDRIESLAQGIHVPKSLARRRAGNKTEAEARWPIT